MPRPKAPPRVTGPYSERDGTRFRLRILGHGTVRNLYFASQEEAIQQKAELQAHVATATEHTVSELIETFFAQRERDGQSRPETISNERERLRYFLAPLLDRNIQSITAKQAEELYRTVMETPSAKTGKPLQAASHRFYLGIAKRFFAWAEDQGAIPQSPFQHVRPQGQPRSGKSLLQVEEANRFVSAALKMHDEGNDVLALGSVVALLLGLRASEVLRRRVSDVRDDGNLLSLGEGKHSNARMTVRVPSLLAERLMKLAAEKRPDDLLFGTDSRGQPRHHRVLWNAVGRICERAQVPRVCTHSLRSLWSTLRVDADAATEVVAARLLPKDSGPSAQSLEEQATRLLAQLPADTVERLLKQVRREGNPESA